MLQNPKWDEGLLDLTKPSLEALAHILRHRELWPEDFEWYFGSCHHCAMGMARALWEWDEKYVYPENIALKFSISHQDARDLFCYEYGYGRPNLVSPEMVADWIDTYLANRA